VTASKDRTELFIHRDPFVITQQIGEELKAWNDAGAEPRPIPVDVVAEKTKIMHNLKRLGFGALLLDKDTAPVKVADVVQVLTDLDIADEQQLPEAVKKLEGLTDPEGAQATYGIALEERAKDAANENQSMQEEEKQAA
jgi:hypothetical protein